MATKAFLRLDNAAQRLQMSDVPAAFKTFQVDRGVGAQPFEAVMKKLDHRRAVVGVRRIIQKVGTAQALGPSHWLSNEISHSGSKTWMEPP